MTGKSGSGKSVLMQELVTGLIGAGGEAVVIDDGRSFQHTAEALGGAFIAFGKDPACLNPFAMIDAEHRQPMTATTARSASPCWRASSGGWRGAGAGSTTSKRR